MSSQVPKSRRRAKLIWTTVESKSTWPKASYNYSKTFFEYSIFNQYASIPLEFYIFAHNKPVSVRRQLQK